MFKKLVQGVAWLGGKAVDTLFNLLDDEPIPKEFFSHYFSEAELIKSDTAIRHGIKNEPNSQQKYNLMMIAQHLLDPIREKFGAFSPSSGFRSKELNDLIGGAPNSQHMQGEAVDFEVPGVDNLKLYNWIKNSDLPYDQLILEHYEEGNPNSGWIHISYKTQGKRRQAFMLPRRNP